MLLASLPRLFARCFLTLAATFTATTAALLAQSPSAVDGFNPDVDGNVYVLATQADGKLLVGGQFATVGGVARNNLARFNADGSLDTAFNPNANGPVRAIVLQGDNRIVIGGDFTTLQPGATGTAATRNRIARLNADGTVEATFNPNLGGQLQPQVHALLLQPSGQIVAGGTFTTVGTTTRNFIARFNADGSLDAAFNPNPNGMVLALAQHVDNKIVVAGGFTTLQPTGDSSATTRNRIARLNPTGTLDTEFNPNANNGVAALAVQRDGKIVLGGFFTTLQPVGDTSPANRTHLARLNVNGTLDSEFYPRAEGNVSSIALQADGGLLIGGIFNAVWGRGTTSTSRGFVARFNGDGSLDPDFAPFVNAEVRAFAFQADGKIVIGGNFTRAQPNGAVAALIRNHLARLNPDGSFDANFELDAGGRTLVSVTQADGKIVIGGTFTSVGGATHNYVARLNADGSVDSTYNPDFNGRVYTMAYEASSNKVIVGGAFTTIGGEPRNHIARLNANGTIDSEFNPNIDGQVGVVLLQSDGKILVGGTFNSVQPLGSATTTSRANLLRLNSNGTLDTPFDPSPNSTVSALALQSDGKILVGGLFNTLTPGFAANISATTTNRPFFARLNADGTLDTAFQPNPNAQISTIVVQSDGKIVIGGGFTGLAPTVGTTVATELTSRNRIARLNADGGVDAAYNPNANGNVLTAALQSDGKILIGGTFTTLQPNADTVFTLRKYAARLNTDGSVDATFNLDLNELSGNRVDSIRIQADNRVLIGGNFSSLQPAGTAARLTRRNFVRLVAGSTAVDTAFDANTGGSTGAIVNGLAIQPDGKVIAVGSFADLGGAKSTNIARYGPEGTPDPEFSSSLTTDGPVNAVVVRPNGAPVPSQAAGFAWLNANGTLRSAFSTTTRLSGEVQAVAVQADGRLIVGGAFANLSNTTAGNLVRFSAAGVLDPSFNPAPNGAVSAIVIQNDGRIVIGGSFTIVNGVARNRLARINADGSLDTTYDPSASAKVNALALQTDGAIVAAGAFTTFTPNLSATVVTRNYIARINPDGNIDAGYNPTPNFTVNTVALQSDGKIVAGGGFTTLQPNSGVDVFTRSGIARINTDGTLDQNFNPNVNSAVNAVVLLPNGQMLVGGSFTTVQPNAAGTVYTRNNLARINSDGALDLTFDPNANGAVTTIAVQADGQYLLGGNFTALQPNATGAAVTRNHLARIGANGALDPNFNPDVNGSVIALLARPDGTVIVGGSFTDLQLNGALYVGGNFANIGGVGARNLAALNENGSVNPTFQPRPDGAVNALLVQSDGKVVVAGAFTNIAGAARGGLARFNADGSLDTAFAPAAAPGPLLALALQPDGKILVSGDNGSLFRLNANGSVDAAFEELPGGRPNPVTPPIHDIKVQPDGKFLTAGSRLRRHNADGTFDTSFAAAVSSGNAIALQADGRVVVATATGVSRVNADGTTDASFNPAVNGRVTAVAIQADGRIMIGGGFNSVGGQPRVGIARLSATSPAMQVLGVAANRGAVMWNRSGTTAELSSVIFEQSSDRITWTRLGEGTRVAGTSNWQLTGLNLPATGLFYIRARGIAPTSGGGSSGLFEGVREFTFSGPVIGTNAPIASVPQTGAAPAFDAYSGIVPRAAVSVVAGEGSVEIFVASSVPTLANARPARLANLSTRGRVAADSPLILGFAISGTESRRVLVRAVGPALTGFGVSGALTATRLQIFNAAGALLSSNEGWGNAAELVQTAAATGAFPLTAGSADSAAVLTLAPGNYTIQVGDARGTGGVGLAEIYDAGSGTASRLVNVSSRASAGTGANALISGFVIAGDTPQRVLLRAVGPGLARFGAGTVVADPMIALFDAEGRELGANDNWVSSIATVSSAAASSGAFALDAGSKDAAVLATLPSGAYTIQVSAPTTGAALLEIYEVR